MVLPVRPVNVLRIAIAHDCELVAEGVRAMLAGHHGGLTFTIDAYDPGAQMADVVLFEPTARLRASEEMARLAAITGRVVAFSWSVDPRAVDAAFRDGASGYLYKGLRSVDLAASLLAIHTGTQVRCFGDARPPSVHNASVIEERGLTPREVQVLGMIAQGLTNAEIADAMFLTVNTVKTYIRSAYGKARVNRRPLAVLWAIEHGLA